MLMWLLLATAHAATPAGIQEAMTEFNQGAVFELPSLSSAQLDQLAGGQVVSMLTRKSASDVWRALGIVVAKASQRSVWLSCQDPHYSNVDRVTEFQLAGGPHTDRASWYGHLDLPMPVVDRHWVVNVWNNHELARQTGGRMWEHPWRVDEGGLERIRPHVVAGSIPELTEAMLDASIYTPVNDGAWVAIQLSEGETLLAYHGATDIGGMLPGKLIAQFTASGMQTLLERVAIRARDEVPQHYRGNHATVIGGDGIGIERYP